MQLSDRILDIVNLKCPAGEGPYNSSQSCCPYASRKLTSNKASEKYEAFSEAFPKFRNLDADWIALFKGSKMLIGYQLKGMATSAESFPWAAVHIPPKLLPDENNKYNVQPLQAAKERAHVSAQGIRKNSRRNQFHISIYSMSIYFMRFYQKFIHHCSVILI